VTVFLSSWEDQLPDGTLLEGRGVTPDVSVKANLGEFRQRDPVLDAALRVVREGL
jgi:C-terminal processing protease CtpA/Prc